MLGITAAVSAACQNAPRAGESPASADAATIASVSVAEAHAATSAASDAQLIDVRTAEEYAGRRAAGAVNLPLDELAANFDKLDKDRPVYVICETGRRSKKGADLLWENGFRRVFNVEGGTSAWTAADLPTEK